MSLCKRMQPPSSRTVFALLSEQAARSPDHPIAITATETVSYATLADRARRVASALRARGVVPGDAIGLLSDNRVEWLEIFFGASALGAVVVPISTWSTAAELDFLLSDSGVRVLFTLARKGEQAYADDVAAIRAAGGHEHLERVIIIDGPTAAGEDDYASYRTSEALPVLSSAADAAYPMVVLYTSGSSSRPKAVPLDDHAALQNGFNIAERQGLLTSDRVLISIPLFWSYGAANALMATLTHGATLVLQSRFEPGGALDLIEDHACTAIYTLPAMTSALLAHPDFAPQRTASLRTGVTIGAPQDIVRAAEELGVREICNIYGSTECYGNCCVTPHDWTLAQRAACQGPPLPGVRLRIRDPQSGEICTPGAVGLIEVSGYLTHGYAGASARYNADVFTDDGYFKTGDLGSVSPDGALTYAGRNSEMIKRSGINVSPAEVEEALQQHPDVALAGVTGVADPVKGEIIVAFVVARRQADTDTQILLAHCRAQLSRYKVPDRLYWCNGLPLTATGKLMRRDLRSLATAVVEAERS